MKNKFFSIFFKKFFSVANQAALFRQSRKKEKPFPEGEGLEKLLPPTIPAQACQTPAGGQAFPFLTGTSCCPHPACILRNPVCLTGYENDRGWPGRR
jgi:hypothetical protein